MGANSSTLQFKSEIDFVILITFESIYRTAWEYTSQFLHNSKGPLYKEVGFKLEWTYFNSVSYPVTLFVSAKYHPSDKPYEIQ